MAARRGTLFVRNRLSPAEFPKLKQEFVDGFDDIILLEPLSAMVASAAAGMIARRGTFNVVGKMPLDCDPQIDVGRIHYDYIAYLGTSGSTLLDQSSVIRTTLAGELSPGRSVAAIGSMEAVHDGFRALIEGRYPGKILIFSQLSGLPLTSLTELKDVAPSVATCLDINGGWTRQAESTLIELFWKP